MKDLMFPKVYSVKKKKKVINKVRKTTVTKLKKQLMILVKQYVRQRDKYTCQHCLKVFTEGSGALIQVSHVMPVSSGNILAFDPINMKLLCYHCHLNWWHKNPLEATEWFRKAFPDRCEYLDKRKHEVVNWKAFDYEQMIAKWEDLK